MKTTAKDLEIFNSLKSTHHSQETQFDVIEEYWRTHFKRILYTYNFIEIHKGECLELGASPYFMTMLLKKFTKLNITLANYFDPDKRGETIPLKIINNNDCWKTQYYNFNVEEDKFPFKDAQFDLVLFCEMIEHLQSDPVFTLKEIRRVLRPDGILILTTPNINKIQNIQKLLLGMNIYDSYSPYGPYGRHNREYNVDDLRSLLTYCGYSIEKITSQDVYGDEKINYRNWLINKLFKPGIEKGHIISVKAKKIKLEDAPKPGFLR